MGAGLEHFQQRVTTHLDASGTIVGQTTTGLASIALALCLGGGNTQTCRSLFDMPRCPILLLWQGGLGIYLLGLQASIKAVIRHTLYAIVRMASDMLISSWRSLGSGVASTRNSARLSPSCNYKSRDESNVRIAAQSVRASFDPSRCLIVTLALVSTALLRMAERTPRVLCCLAAAVKAPHPAKLLCLADATTCREALPTVGRTKACKQMSARHRVEF